MLLAPVGSSGLRVRSLQLTHPLKPVTMNYLDKYLSAKFVEANQTETSNPRGKTIIKLFVGPRISLVFPTARGIYLAAY